MNNHKTLPDSILNDAKSYYTYKTIEQDLNILSDLVIKYNYRKLSSLISKGELPRVTESMIMTMARELSKEDLKNAIEKLYK